MNTNESNLAPPGAPRGGYYSSGQALGAPGGVSVSTMKDDQADPAALRALLAKAREQLTAALASNAKLYLENKWLKEAAAKGS